MISHGRWSAVAWTLAVLLVPLGFFIGYNVNAQVGIGLWFLAAVLGLAPFANHRNL